MSNDNVTSIVTPKGQITFLAVARQIPKRDRDGQQLQNKNGDPIKQYVARLLIDGTTEKGKAFKQVMLAHNDRTIIQSNGANGIPEGWYRFGTTNIFEGDVSVSDEKGNLLRGKDIPYFHSDTDSGEAILTIELDSKYHSTRLKAVMLDLSTLKIEPKEELSDEEYQAAMQKARTAAELENAKAMAALNNEG